MEIDVTKLFWIYYQSAMKIYPCQSVESVVTFPIPRKRMQLGIEQLVDKGLWTAG